MLLKMFQCRAVKAVPLVNELKVATKQVTVYYSIYLFKEIEGSANRVRTINRCKNSDIHFSYSNSLPELQCVTSIIISLHGSQLTFSTSESFDMLWVHRNRPTNCIVDESNNLKQPLEV